MRTRKIIAYVALSAGIFFTACQKDKDQIPPPVTMPRQVVKYFDTSFPSNNIILKYDAQGRLIEQVSAYGYKYSYTGNIFGGVFTNQNNYNYFTWTNGTLDSKGRLLSVDGVATPLNGPLTNHKYAFTYNAEGYLVKVTHTNLATNNVSQDDYTYVNGNLVTDLNSFNGQPNYRIEYKYYDNLVNPFTVDIFQTIFGNITDAVTGKRSKNLIKQETVYTPQNVITLDEVYEWKLDNQGYPVYYTGKNLATNYAWAFGFEYDK